MSSVNAVAARDVCHTCLLTSNVWYCCLFAFLRCLQNALRKTAVAASALHTTGLLQTSNKTSVVRCARNKYERQYPVLLVRPDGSTINIRYKEPKRIIMVWETVYWWSSSHYLHFAQRSAFRLFSWYLIQHSDAIFICRVSGRSFEWVHLHWFELFGLIKTPRAKSQHKRFSVTLLNFISSSIKSFSHNFCFPHIWFLLSLLSQSVFKNSILKAWPYDMIVFADASGHQYSVWRGEESQTTQEGSEEGSCEEGERWLWRWL